MARRCFFLLSGRVALWLTGGWRAAAGYGGGHFRRLEIFQVRCVSVGRNGGFPHFVAQCHKI